ncbi:MAG: PIN/TRAM domain-containing protein [Luteolibacter sp.]
MASPASVNIARLSYLLICEAAGVAIALSTRGTLFEVPLWIGICGGLGVAGLFIWIESLMKGFTLRGFSTATFGLGVGLLCAWLLTRVEISNLLEIALRERLASSDHADVVVNASRLAIDVALFASLGFLGAVLSLRGNRDDFALIIPYIRFRQDAATGQPILLDAEAVIDGRVHGIMRSGFLHGRVIVPSFVLDVLQNMAQNPDPDDRQRGQRGLDVLDTMQKAPHVQISIDDTRSADAENNINAKLIESARLLGARILTPDDTLSKMARLQNVDVLNIHELDEALKPTIAPGQRLRITLVRTGKEDHQAVGYLPDGSMIVVNHAIAQMGNSVDVNVVSTLQTASGTMAFAEMASPKTR